MNEKTLREPTISGIGYLPENAGCEGLVPPDIEGVRCLDVRDSQSEPSASGVCGGPIFVLSFGNGLNVQNSCPEQEMTLAYGFTSDKACCPESCSALYRSSARIWFASFCSGPVGKYWTSSSR